MSGSTSPSFVDIMQERKSARCKISWMNDVGLDFVLCACGGPRRKPTTIKCFSLWLRPRLAWMLSKAPGALSGDSGLFVLSCSPVDSRSRDFVGTLPSSCLGCCYISYMKNTTARSWCFIYQHGDGSPFVDKPMATGGRQCDIMMMQRSPVTNVTNKLDCRFMPVLPPGEARCPICDTIHYKFILDSCNAFSEVLVRALASGIRGHKT